MRISYSGPESLKKNVEGSFEVADRHISYFFKKVSVNLVGPGDARTDGCYGACEEGHRVLGSIEEISCSIQKGEEKSISEWALHEIVHCMIKKKTVDNPRQNLLPYSNIDEGAAYAIGGSMKEFCERHFPARLFQERIVFESLLNIFPSSLVIQSAADAMNNAYEKDSSPMEELFVTAEEKEFCLKKGISLLFP